MKKRIYDVVTAAAIIVGIIGSASDQNWVAMLWAVVAGFLFLAWTDARNHPAIETHLTVYGSPDLDEREFANRIADALRQRGER